MSRKITLNITGESNKQYPVLVLELNNMSKAWRRFGVNIEINSPSSDKIIRWGNKRYDERNIQPEVLTEVDEEGTRRARPLGFCLK